MKVLNAEYDVIIRFSGLPFDYLGHMVDGRVGFRTTAVARRAADAIKDALNHAPMGIIERITGVDVS